MSIGISENKGGGILERLVYIFGHRNPDADSICAAIAYADLKRSLGYKAIACRLGDINDETKFILDYFDLELPKYLDNVKTQVSDLEIDKVDHLSYDISIKTAWSIMQENGIKTYPVVDSNDKLTGIISLSNITEKYMDVLDYKSLANCNTSVDNILETIKGEIIGGHRDNFNITGKIVILANLTEDKGDHLEKGDIVITGNREEAQREALNLGANCLIVTCNTQVKQEIIDLALKTKAIIIKTDYDTFTTARLINQSIPIGSIMTKNEGDTIIKFKIDDYVDGVREGMIKHRHRSYPIVDHNEQVLGMISRYHLISQRKKQVILVDHNEKMQTVNGIEEAEILEIIDHHKLGDLTTAKPIFFKNELVGSTSTIIADLFSLNGKKPTKQIAGILCAAIISDTLKFQSSTSTDKDYQSALKLASIARIDIDEFASEMFKAGTLLTGKSPKEIFYQDFKNISLFDYEIGISQVTVYESDKLELIKGQIIEYMEAKGKKGNYSLMVLMVTDLTNKATELQFSGKLAKSLANELSFDSDTNGTIYPAIMSRKKDVIPLIASAIEKMEI